MTDKAKVIYSALHELSYAIGVAMAALEGTPASAAPTSFACDRASPDYVPQEGGNERLLPTAADALTDCEFEHERLHRENEARREAVKAIEDILDQGGSFTYHRSSTVEGVQLLLDTVNNQIRTINELQPLCNKLSDGAKADAETIVRLNAGTNHHNEAIKARDLVQEKLTGLDLRALSPAQTITILAETIAQLTEALTNASKQREADAEREQQLRFMLEQEQSFKEAAQTQLAKAREQAAKAADMAEELAGRRTRDELNATAIKTLMAEMPPLKLSNHHGVRLSPQSAGEADMHVTQLLVTIRALVAEVVEARNAPDENRRFKRMVDEAVAMRASLGQSLVAEMSGYLGSPAETIRDLGGLLNKARYQLKEAERTIGWRDNEIDNLKTAGHVGDFSTAKLEQRGYLITKPDGTTSWQDEKPLIKAHEKKAGWTAQGAFVIGNREAPQAVAAE